jgi:cytochrome c oxidase cbb3-type subunit 2
MNHMWRLLVGIIFVVVFSFSGLVLAPGAQQGWSLPRQIDTEDGSTEAYPVALSDYLEKQGAAVYRAEGCLYCHSQQVRHDKLGNDEARGYGDRRSVPLDYVLDDPPLVGTMRTGPDLSNIAVRQPSDMWHHVHLFDARIVSKGSVMPPLRFLYKVVHEDPGSKGYALDDSYYGEKSWIVPEPDALALVAYLKTRHQDHPLNKVQ